MSKTSKKQVKILAAVLEISTSVTVDPYALLHIINIGYPIYFLASEIKALINFSSKINAMILIIAAILDLTSRLTTVNAQKIDGLLLKTYGMNTKGFLVYNSLEKC